MTNLGYQNRNRSLSRHQSLAQIDTLAIWGDPVIGRALVLLLRGSGYKARFLPASSLNEPGALKGVRLLLVAPTPQLRTEHRDAFLGSLKDTLEGGQRPVLELVTRSEDSRAGAARDDSWHTVPWPCKLEELEQQIEAALPPHYETEAKGLEALRARRSREHDQQSLRPRRSASG
jgi:hypothetical protein